MKMKYWNMFGFSFMLGSIATVICSSYVDILLALALGAFTFAVFFIVFFIYMRIYSRRCKHISNPDTKTIFKEAANYYTDKLVGNVVLLLSDKALYFYLEKKGQIIKTTIHFHRVEDVSYETIFRHLKGVKIRLKDGSTLGFTTPRYKFLLEQLNLMKMDYDNKPKNMIQQHEAQ